MRTACEYWAVDDVSVTDGPVSLETGLFAHGSGDAVLTPIVDLPEGKIETASLALPEQNLWVLAKRIARNAQETAWARRVVQKVARRMAQSSGLETAVKEALREAGPLAQDEMCCGVVAVSLCGASYEVVWYGGAQAYHWRSQRLDRLTLLRPWVLRRLMGDEVAQDEIVVGRCRGRLYAGEHLVLCGQFVGLGGAEMRYLHERQSLPARNLDDVSRRCGDDEAILLVTAPPQASAPPSLARKPAPSDGRGEVRPVARRFNRWTELAIVFGATTLTAGLLALLAAFGWNVDLHRQVVSKPAAQQAVSLSRSHENVAAVEKQ